MKDDTCDFCSDKAIGWIYGDVKAYCAEHQAAALRLEQELFKELEEYYQWQGC